MSLAKLTNTLRISKKNVRHVKLKWFQNDTLKKDEILQKRRDNYARFKDLDNRSKALEKKALTF